MRWKWNPLDGNNCLPKGNGCSTGKANWEPPIKTGAQNNTVNTKCAVIGAPSIHTHPVLNFNSRSGRLKLQMSFTLCHWSSYFLHSELPRASLGMLHLTFALQAGVRVLRKTGWQCFVSYICVWQLSYCHCPILKLWFCNMETYKRRLLIAHN